MMMMIMKIVDCGGRGRLNKVRSKTPFFFGQAMRCQVQEWLKKSLFPLYGSSFPTPISINVAVGCPAPIQNAYFNLHAVVYNETLRTGIEFDIII